MSADGTGLTEFQLEVAHVFFELPASDGFLLAGGAGLVASGLTTRPTQDLDFFKSTPSVTAARDEFERAASVRDGPCAGSATTRTSCASWSVARRTSSSTSARTRRSRSDLLELAAEIDAGLQDPEVFARDAAMPSNGTTMTACEPPAPDRGVGRRSDSTGTPANALRPTPGGALASEAAVRIELTYRALQALASATRPRRQGRSP